MSSESSEQSQAAFHGVLASIKKEYENLPDGDTLYEKLSTRLQQTYDKPPLEECNEYVSGVHSAALSLEELRMIMFEPSLDQVKFYAVFLNNENQQHRSNKVKSIFLTLLFLIHRNAWWFMAEFVLQDGIQALASLFVDDNLYYRGQAVDIMLSLIDCDTYDWFQSPLAGLQDYKLHQKVLQVLHPAVNSGAATTDKDSILLRNLCANNCTEADAPRANNIPTAQSPTVESLTFPGGSFKCLQILGFWLSWCRRLYTPMQVLKLNPKIILELKKWRRNPHASSHSMPAAAATKSGVTELEEGEEEQLERIKFADQLYKDFAVQQFKAHDTSDPDGGSNAADAAAAAADDDDDATEDAEGDASAGPYTVSGVDVCMLVMPREGGGGSSSSGADPLPPLPPQSSSSSSAAAHYASSAVGKAGSSASSSAATMAAAAGNIAAPMQPADYKEQGNEYYHKSLFNEAAKQYSRGITELLVKISNEKQQQPGDIVALENSSDRAQLVTMMFNIATVLWKVYSLVAAEEVSAGEKSTAAAQEELVKLCRSYSSVIRMTVPVVIVSESAAQRVEPTASAADAAAGDSSKYAVSQLLRLCECVCRSILLLNRKHVKAIYRLANVLLKLQRASEALALVDGALADFSVDAENSTKPAVDSGDEDATQTLKSVRTQCIAAMLVTGSQQNTSTGASAPLVNNKVNSILLALQARREKEKKSAEPATPLPEENNTAAGGGAAADGSKGPTRKLTGVLMNLSLNEIDEEDAAPQKAVATRRDDEPEESSTTSIKAMNKVLQLSQSSKSGSNSSTSGSKAKSKTGLAKSGGKATSKSCVIPGLESLGDLKTLNKKKKPQGSAAGATSDEL